MRISDWSSDVCAADLGINTTSITTCASRDGEGWRLNGRKIWITAVPDSDKMLVIARPQRLDEVRDRKRVVSGQRVSVRLDIGGRLIINKKTHIARFRNKYT